MPTPPPHGPQTPTSRPACSRSNTSPAVCFIVTLASKTGRYGGPFDAAAQQASLLADSGYQVEMLAGCLAGDGPVRDRRFRAGWVDVGRWLATPDFTGLLSWRMIGAIWRAAGRADIVHVAFARELIPVVAVAIALLRRRAIVLQPHGMLTSRSSNLHRVLDRVVGPLIRRSDTVVALTDVEKQEVLARFQPAPTQITIIGNAVPFDEYDAERLRAAHASANPSALFIGRLHPRKRVLLFAAAAREAAAAGWTEIYEVVGPDQGDLARLLDLVAATPNLRYEGAIDGRDVPDRLVRSSVLVLTSCSEPWGNVLAMAVALGVPAVLTASSALAPTLNGVEGVRIVQDGDARGLAGAVHDLLDQGSTVSPLVAGFTREDVRKRLMKMYEGVLSTAAIRR